MLCFALFCVCFVCCVRSDTIVFCHREWLQNNIPKMIDHIHLMSEFPNSSILHNTVKPFCQAIYTESSTRSAPSARRSLNLSTPWPIQNSKLELDPPPPPTHPLFPTRHFWLSTVTPKTLNYTVIENYDYFVSFFKLYRPLGKYPSTQRSRSRTTSIYYDWFECQCGFLKVPCMVPIINILVFTVCLYRATSLI